MGKLADALEKAGYGEHGTDQAASPAEVDSTDQTVEVRAPVDPQPHQSTLGQANKSGRARRSKGDGGTWDERLFKAVNRDSYLPEIFKTLRSRILHPPDGVDVPKTIMVTSAIPKEGKSFVTANLGISLAQGLDQYALLVDCDLRRPALASLFGLSATPGLVDYLRDGSDLGELIAKTSVDKLSLLPSGETPVNPAELLGSARMEGVVKELSSRYDDRIIIFDSPPFQVASEASVLARRVDGIILVVREGGAGKPQVRMLMETIGPDRIIGVVFNAYTTNVVERSLMKGYGYYQQTY